MGDFTYTLLVIQLMFVSQDYSPAQYSQGLAALLSFFSLSFFSFLSMMSSIMLFQAMRLAKTTITPLFTRLTIVFSKVLSQVH